MTFVFMVLALLVGCAHDKSPQAAQKPSPAELQKTGEDGFIYGLPIVMNYAVMRAADMPTMILGETITPNPFNPLGVKGVGECGTNGAPPSVANALMDALRPLGIDHVDMPYTAPKLWEIIRRAEKN